MLHIPALLFTSASVSSAVFRAQAKSSSRSWPQRCWRTDTARLVLSTIPIIHCNIWKPHKIVKNNAKDSDWVPTFTQPLLKTSCNYRKEDCVTIQIKWNKAELSLGNGQQALVVQKVDNSIHRINHNPVDSVVRFVNTYPLDGVIQPLNNRGQYFLK